MKKIELKLTNIARGSLDELKLDYEQFLRHWRMNEWLNTDPRRKELVSQRCANADQLAEWVKTLYDRDYPRNSISKRTAYAEITANAMIVLTGVTIALLNRQIKALSTDFEDNGGFTERMFRVRKNIKRKNK